MDKRFNRLVISLILIVIIFIIGILFSVSTVSVTKETKKVCLFLILSNKIFITLLLKVLQEKINEKEKTKVVFNKKMKGIYIIFYQKVESNYKIFNKKIEGNCNNFK